MHDLNLDVNLTGWRLFARRKEDKAFTAIATRVLDRDWYTCQFCGFQAKAYQEIVNLDGNYQNNKLSNMVTACCFCSQCLFLQAVGLDDMSGGQLVYLPEMSQADLNSFCHVLFCALGSSAGYQDTAQMIYRSLKFRSQVIEKRLGTGMSNPAFFGQAIIECQSGGSEQQATHLLRDLRLLPSNTKFSVQLDAWAQAAIQELEEQSANQATS